MFKKEDFEMLTDVFSLARSKTVDLDINNKNGLIQILNFEEKIKLQMAEVTKKQIETKPESQEKENLIQSK